MVFHSSLGLFVDCLNSSQKSCAFKVALVLLTPWRIFCKIIFLLYCHKKKHDLCIFCFCRIEVKMSSLNYDFFSTFSYFLKVVLSSA